MSEGRRIYGGQVVTPDGVIESGTVVVEGGIITDVLSRAVGGRNDLDASGLWVLPGLIDTHSDAIEIEIQPRPSSIMPVEVSFFELEKKLTVQGITTMYHCMSFSEIPGNELRANDTVVKNIDRLRRFAAGRRLINHRVHVRYEMRNVAAAGLVDELMADGGVHQLSFMDHTPGQGQYRDVSRLRKYMITRRDMTGEEADRLLAERRVAPKASLEVLAGLAARARELGITLATHDDDNVERLDLLQEWGGRICEFPVRLDIAQEAKRRGLAVVVGATNLLLGGSHSGNLAAIDAVRAGCVDILCSDYYPPALLQGAFLLRNLGYDMAWCTRLVTQHPAQALGIDGAVGSLAPGKAADVLLVGEVGGRPVVQKVMVGGRLVASLDYGDEREQRPA